MSGSVHNHRELRPLEAEVRAALGERQPYSMVLLQSQDGLCVYRVWLDGEPAILKYMSDVPERREITNYALLQSLGVPMAKVLAKGESYLLLEDLSCSDSLRLGMRDDLADPTVAVALAEWYRTLHRAGTRVAALEGLWAESDLISADALIALRERFPEAVMTWDYVLDHLVELQTRVAELSRTLTYNDFSWTNLAVSRDGRSALMFDYGLLGRGYPYADWRNVTLALSVEAREAFASAYGSFSEREAITDSCVAPLVNLICANRLPRFPSWADASLRAARDGDLYTQASRLLES
ncbi:MAG: phosphotransferase [Chloroflexi bacterium]|nr:phosphotransferase [Chloroflexota bacterium]